MRRIIQKYQEGGVVQPAPGPVVATGIPQGGHAASAIQSYLSGQAAGPLSYTAGQSTVPDYRALAASRRNLRGSLSTSGLDAATQSSVLNKADTLNVDSSAGNKGGTDRTTYGGHKDVAHQNVDAAFEKGGAGYNAEIAAANPYNTDVTGRSDALGGETLSPTEEYARSMLAAGIKGVGGGYNQNDPTTGLTGAIKDVYGNITSGIKNAVAENALLSLIPGATLASVVAAPISPYTPVTVTQNNNNDGANNDFHSNTPAYTGAGTGYINTKTGETNRYYGARNMGGPIGYNTGGVAVAKSGLREDEIRQRQMMQSRLPQVQQSPLSDIGSKLAMGAVDKGIGSAASSMAAKEGLIGTVGNALGGSAVTGAATGAAGTGMMAALGPIGIGIGLGKLFGLFNDGGKVPCSCGKTTSCKCAKEIKSPLSGE